MQCGKLAKSFVERQVAQKYVRRKSALLPEKTKNFDKKIRKFRIKMYI